MKDAKGEKKNCNPEHGGKIERPGRGLEYHMSGSYLTGKVRATRFLLFASFYPSPAQAQPEPSLLKVAHTYLGIMPTAYTVYVIELSRKVFTEDRKFREANPQYNGVLECLYVGQTSKTPQERLMQHKTGARTAKGHKLSSDIVRKYGLYLRPSLYQDIGSLGREEALEVEKGLALELRRKGYAVWWN